MPTYEYQCRKCARVFEKWQKITDPPLKTCPENRCGGKVCRTIGGGGGFILKGNGFYATDYRSNDYKKRAEKEKSELKGDGTKDKKEKTKENTKKTETKKET